MLIDFVLVLLFKVGFPSNLSTKDVRREMILFAKSMPTYRSTQASNHLSATLLEMFGREHPNPQRHAERKCTLAHISFTSSYHMSHFPDLENVELGPLKIWIVGQLTLVLR